MVEIVKCFLLLQLFILITKAYQNSTRLHTRWLNDDVCGVVDFANPLIYGGMTFTRGAWPYMAAVFHRDTSGSMKFVCGGVILSKTQIITGLIFFLILETSLLIFMS